MRWTKGHGYAVEALMKKTTMYENSFIIILGKQKYFMDFQL